MLGLDHLGRRIQPQLLLIAVEIGDRDEQVERLIIGQQGRAFRAALHRGEGIEDQIGERIGLNGGANRALARRGACLDLGAVAGLASFDIAMRW